MDNAKIGTKEAIALVFSSIVAHSLRSLPRNLISNQKSAVLLNVIFVSIVAVCIGILIYKLFKNFPGKDILDISEYLGGKVFRTILGIIFISYLSISTSMLLINFCEGIKIIYYTKVTFVIGLFIIAIITVNRLNFNASLKTYLIILPIILVGMIFLFLANIKNFTPERIFPILGDGTLNTFVTGLGNLSAFTGIFYLYFLPPLLKEPEKFKKIAVTSIVITGIYLLCIVSILLFMFAYFMNVDEIMPLYSAARNIEFGSFFQRLESVFLLIWIIVFASYIAIAMNFCMQLFKKIANLKDIKPLAYPFGLLFLGIALFPKNYSISNFFATDIYPSLILCVVFIINISVLIISNIKKQKKVGEYNE